jgi:hypothetical protein
MDFFIRSYARDFEWLEYCLKSIHKYYKGVPNIVLVVPTIDYQIAKKFTPYCNIIAATLPQHEDGYICQQISKLRAHTYCDSGYILYVDSDCVFTKKFDITDFMRHEKPLILKTRYELVGDAICWKPSTEVLTGLTLTHEYMRRLPLLYRRDTLINLHKQLPNLLTDAQHIKGRNISEFNIIGAYAEAYEPENYYFLDTDIEVPEKIAEQYWSWGGVTGEIKTKLKEICE